MNFSEKSDNGLRRATSVATPQKCLGSCSNRLE